MKLQGGSSMLSAVIHGFILAIGLILPLGAQNIFIFNQGARAPRITGALAAIIAAAFSDTLLIFLAVSGASLLLFSDPRVQRLIMAGGVLFLIWIGFSIWKEQVNLKPNHAELFAAKKQVTFALSVSLLNPHALLDTIGVIGTNAFNYSGSEKWAFAAACASVSWLWFFGLAWCGHGVGKISDGTRIRSLVNKLSAVMIWGIALYLAFSLLPR